MRYERFGLAVVLAGTLTLLGCGGGGGGDDDEKFAQTWGTAAVQVNNATLPYFPSVNAQSTQISAPGVALGTTIAPPPNTTNTAAIFSNATVRQFMRVSIGGSTVRLRLSNAYSAADLRIDELHVARADRAACAAPVVPLPPATLPRGATCSNIDPATDRAVTVNGSKSFTIPKGQEIYSDAVKLDVPALSDVAVSFYVSGPTPPVTVHPLGVDTAYLVVGADASPANYTAARVFNAATLGGKAALATSTAVFAVVGIDVVAPANTRTIVTFGDSITDGANVLADTNTRWGNYLAARFNAATTQFGKPAVAVSNAGISANRVATDTNQPAGIKRFEQDALSRSGVTDVIVFIGINDIGQPAVPTPTAQITAAYQELVRQARAKKVRIYFATVAPFRTDVATANGTYGGLFSPSEALFAPREAARLEVNAWILAQREADGVYDFNAAVSAPGRLNQMLAANSVSFSNSASNDQLHPNALGQRLFAEALRLEDFYR